MKKYILFIFPLILLFMGFKSYAYSESDVVNLRNTFYSEWGVTLNESLARQVLSKWDDNNDYYLGIQRYNTSWYAFIIGTDSGDKQNGSQWGFLGWKALVDNPTTQTGVNNSSDLTGNAVNYVLTKSGNYRLGPWSSWHTVPIEWDNPQYNPNMPIPVISTNYGEISVNSSSPEIPFDITFINPNNDYYIEIYCDYWIPDNMAIQINRNFANNDGYVYKALSRDLVSGYLIDPEQMLRIQGINNLKLQLQTDWENSLTQVPVSGLEYANPNSLPTGMFNQYKSIYENYCRNILGFYGSQFTIMMRYFTIVNDTQYVVGAWRTWTTYSPNEFTERLPDYYVPYVPASGQENITNNVDPENVEIVQGTGSNTGAISDPNYYITVNQNTPNYPDYPTIASYNKDNLLLDTMNHINSLSTFFGEFGDFLTTSFAFFPAWIWAIIGAGFGISIVVMFLKIL